MSEVERQEQPFATGMLDEERLTVLENKVAELEALRDGVLQAVEQAKQNPMIGTMLRNFGIEL